MAQIYGTNPLNWQQRQETGPLGERGFPISKGGGPFTVHSSSKLKRIAEKPLQKNSTDKKTPWWEFLPKDWMVPMSSSNYWSICCCPLCWVMNAVGWIFWRLSVCLHLRVFFGNEREVLVFILMPRIPCFWCWHKNRTSETSGRPSSSPVECEMKAIKSKCQDCSGV